MIVVKDGTLWVDNQYFCRYGDGYGRAALPAGRFQITIEYSELDKSFLPRAGDIGWLGSRSKRGLVLGHVLARHGVYPCRDVSLKFSRLIDTRIKAGLDVYLEVPHGYIVR